MEHTTINNTRGWARTNKAFGATKQRKGKKIGQYIKWTLCPSTDDSNGNPHTSCGVIFQFFQFYWNRCQRINSQCSNYEAHLRRRSTCTIREKKDAAIGGLNPFFLSLSLWLSIEPITSSRAATALAIIRAITQFPGTSFHPNCALPSSFSSLSLPLLVGWLVHQLPARHIPTFRTPTTTSRSPTYNLFKSIQITQFSERVKPRLTTSFFVVGLLIARLTTFLPPPSPPQS